MAVADLLWIDCSETQPAKRYEAAAAARQHVMLNYIAKQQPEHTCSPREGDGKDVSGEDEDNEEAAKDDTITKRKPSPRRRQSHALKGKGTRIKKGIPLSASTKIPLTTTINPALILPEDNQIYQAAWWHSLNLYQTPQRPNNWIDTCRAQWGQGFWEFAKEDGTLREIFLSYAAAKEASVKSLADSRDYFVHKGRAMRLVANDLKREGRDLRMAAVATICLLAKATFIEEEYEAGEAHMRAIKAVVEDRLFELPSFLWLFVIWADLRLTGVSSRAPALPYGLHPDFEGTMLPVGMRERAKFLGSCNVLSLPSAVVLREERIALLFQRLHELALVYNKPDETDWPPVWAVTYDAAWMLSSMRNEVRSFEETQERTTNRAPYNVEKILLLAASFQMWSTVSQFVPQPGFLRYALDQLTLSLAHLDPQVVLDHWTASAGKPDSLLWILFNASAAAIKLCFTGHLSPASMPHWLWLDLQHLCSTLKITTSSAFEQALRPFPFADNWNGRMAGTVWLWLKTGFVLPEKRRGRRLPFFADLRLTFDVEVDERERTVREGFEKEGDVGREAGCGVAREVVGRAYEVVLVGPAH